MSALLERPDIRDLVGPVFIVAFLASLIVEHFWRGLIGLAVYCVAVEVLCVAILGLQRRWWLAASSIILVIVTATGLP